MKIELLDRANIIQKKNIETKNNIKGLVFDIQRFCVHDGPGIRTLVFLKGCTMNCKWCCNPEGNKNTPELMYYYFKCNSCEKCIVVCPQKALNLDSARDHIIINRQKCNLCGKCIDVCNTSALFIPGKYMTIGECIEEIEKDTMFYKNSGGGITISGGEPFLQDVFTMNLLKECKEKGCVC